MRGNLRGAGGRGRSASAPFFGNGLDFLLGLGGGVVVHFALDEFKEGDIGGAEGARLVDERAAVAATGGQLAHAARHQIDQDIWVADLCQGLFEVFAVNEPLKVRGAMANATIKSR